MISSRDAQTREAQTRDAQTRETLTREAPRRRACLFAATVLLVMLPVAHAPAVRGQAAADVPRPIEPVDILDWKAIGISSLSHDGKWFAYRFSPVQGDSTVIIRATGGDKEYRFGIGELPPPSPTPGLPGAAAPTSSALAFSDDGRWVAFTAYPTRAEAERLRKERKPIQTSVRLVHLSTGTDVVYPKVRQFAFSGESSLAIALHRHAPEGADGQGARGGAGAGSGGSTGTGGGTPGGSSGGGAGRERPKGTDLIVRDLTAGTDLTIGSVAEFAFDKAGRRLAWTIDAEDRIGNGVSVRDLKTGIVTTHDSGKASYEKVTWTEQGDALAVLKGTEHKAYVDKLYAVVGVSGLGDDDGGPSARARKAIYDPATDTTFPTGMTISANRAPTWTDDRQALLFGIVQVKKKDDPAAATTDADEKTATNKGGNKDANKDAAKDVGKDGNKDAGKDASREKPASAAARASGDGEANEEKADLVLWHWKDRRLQSQQQVQEERDKRFSYLATWRVAEKKFLRLADDTLRDVTPPKKGHWAVGIDRQAYELTGSLEGRNYQDLSVVDLQTGARTPVAKQLRWFYGQSPDGARLLYYRDGHFHVFDIAAGKATNITQQAPVSFVDVEDDHNVIQPPVAPEGWVSDSKSVLLGDRWDVWQVPVGGGAAVNLTGNGRRDRIRYDRVALPDESDEGIDLTIPQYYLMLGEWTKKGGIARAKPPASGAQASAAAAEVLAWDDAAYTRLTKAKRADTVAYTRETAKDFPDVHVADAALKGSRRITDGQTQLAPYAWSAGARLLDFTSRPPTTRDPADTSAARAKGKKLQAALYLPASYEPGRKYPTIVYIYEHLTDNYHRFVQPDTAHRVNKSFYTSQGYAVLQPDISYTINDPGMSAVWCVLPALEAAIATGIVDPARVGIQGHSWGGYQTSFLVTQTNAFKAAIAGAPLTDMISMYGLVYKNTGGGNMAIFESSQGRFRGGYWDHWDAYVRNSPIAHAAKVTTPLVILHNDRDGAVDFTQGIEYYNTLRRLGKPVALLQYVGENHGLVKPSNKFDYMVRMKEFFDHQLKGAPAPGWWTEGILRLDMDEHLKGRQPSPKKAPAPSAPTPTTTQTTPAAAAAGAVRP